MCGCEKHWKPGAPCTCNCPEHAAGREVPCPLPGCTEPLYIVWERCYTLSPEDLRPLGNDERLVNSSDAHTATWQVQCTDGHVVLLPGDVGCPCPPEQQGTDACPHGDDAYDWSEDTRRWREHDVERLRSLIDSIREEGVA